METGVENSAYFDGLARMIRKAEERVGNGDMVDLASLVDLQTILDESIATAVARLHEHGYSWEDIAQATGVNKSTAFRRWNVA